MNSKSVSSISQDSEKTKLDEDFLGLEEAIQQKEKAHVGYDSGFSCALAEENNSVSFVETNAHIPHYSQEDEKKLVRKLDLRIMPLFCLFYFVDFLDRANIGNATLAGLRTDLGMTTYELSTAISAFFITYILFEVPSNVVLKRTNAVMWLSFIMLVWGFATLLTAFVTDFKGLLIARLILGAAESGYIPGIMFLLSKFYSPREFSMRVSILMTMATLSGLLSGPLTYTMSYLDGKNGLHDWQYLFIVEGAPTIALAIASYFFLFDDLQNVKWLSTEQKAVQANRMIIHQNTDTNHGAISLQTFKDVFSDWKTWAFCIVFLLNSINVTSITVFAPTLIDGFGFDPKTSQLLTAPPCAIATIGVLAGGYLSGCYNRRSPLLATGSIIIAIGYTCLLLLSNKWALYCTLFLIPIGMGMQAAAAMGWSAINYPDLNIRAVAVATVLMVGNVGSIIAAYLFRSQDAPRYEFGMIFNLITAIVSCIISTLTGYLLYRENRRRDKYPTEANRFRFFY